ncbi:MAG: sensor histidine kinase [Vicinamibacterales bacterium]
MTTIEYAGDDPTLPDDVRAFHRERGIDLLLIAPLRLAEKNLGWLALASANESECDRQWRRALLDATARQATLALYYSRLVDRSLLEARRQAVLEERNSIARDIHDTLAQGFGAILMQLQAARREGDGQLPDAVARNLDTAIELSRRHLVDARRSVAALRPQFDERADVGRALADMVDFARRTCDVPSVELRMDDLPAFDAGVEREIIGIAQEALTNATRHARARRIIVTAGAVRGVGFRLSVADDGRGMSGDCQSSGFGLTSMRERAERIGASLTFVTAPRAGTEVVLAWQPAVLLRSHGRPMPSTDTASAVEQIAPGRARVLVVDDHSLLRTGVANIINQEDRFSKSSRRLRTGSRPSRRSPRIVQTSS